MKINKIRPTAINESLCATETAFEEVKAAQEEVEDCRKEIEKEIEAADTHKDVVFEKTIKEGLELKEEANAYLGRNGKVTIADYKHFLEKALEVCDWYDDDAEVYINSNTYRIAVPFIGTYGGYIEINQPVHEDEEDYDECLKEANDAEIAARKEAENILKEHPSLYAIIYGYHKDGEFVKYNRYLASEEALREETANIEKNLKPTGSVAVAYKHSLSTWESLDVKDRNELSKVIKECKENNKKFKISRSLKEGYRYTIHTAKSLEEANLNKLAAEEIDAIASYDKEIKDSDTIEEEETLKHIKGEEEEHLDELKDLQTKTESLEENNLTESAWDKICAVLGCDEEVEEEKVFKEHVEEAEENTLTESTAETAHGEAIDRLVTSGEAKNVEEAEKLLASKDEDAKETVDEITPFDESLTEKKVEESAWDKIMTFLNNTDKQTEVEENLEEEKEICPECGKEVCECNKTLKEETKSEETKSEETALVDLGDNVEFFDSFDDVPELEAEEDKEVKDTYDAGDFDYEEMLDSISFITADDDNPIEQNKTFNFDIYKTEDGKYVAFGNETPFGPADDPEELKNEIRDFMKDSNFEVKEEAEAYETVDIPEEEIEIDDDIDLELPEEEPEEIKEEEPVEEIDLDSLDKEEPEVFEFEDESDLDL